MIFIDEYSIETFQNSVYHIIYSFKRCIRFNTTDVINKLLDVGENRTNLTFIKYENTGREYDNINPHVFLTIFLTGPTFHFLFRMPEVPLR